MKMEQKKKLIKTQIDKEYLKELHEQTGIRPVILAFAVEMERKLVENDHKGGWRECKNRYLFNRLAEESWELKNQVKAYKRESKKDSEFSGLAAMMDVRKEAADVANFALMIADNNSVL